MGKQLKTEPGRTQPPAIIILGAPGSGKGTQARLLSQKLGMVHITTGGLIRDKMETDTAFGRRHSQAIAQGKMLPDSIVLQILEQRLSHPDTRKGIILDGVPRNSGQIAPTQKLLGNNGFAKPVAVLLQVPDSQIQARIGGRSECSKCHETYHSDHKPTAQHGFCDKCGGPLVTRHDDKPEVVKERLKLYHKVTRPVADHYRKLKGLHTILDHGQGITQINAEILSKLKRSLGP